MQCYSDLTSSASLQGESDQLDWSLLDRLPQS